jgi:hypothetical protein
MFNVLGLDSIHMNSAMIGHQISLVHNMEEAKPGTFVYTFIAIMSAGRFGLDGVAAISHGASPELAIHNVIDYYKLKNNKEALLPKELHELEEHEVQSKEAQRLLTSTALPWETAGTPSARLHYLFDELDQRFPNAVSPVSSEPPEPKYLAAIDKLMKTVDMLTDVSEQSDADDLNTFGPWIDHVTDTTADEPRDLQTVMGRALEEMVEGCLSAGLTYGKIMGHVADAWHNQCLKESRKADRTVWPSQLQDTSGSIDELAGELADIRLTLVDVMWLARVSEARVQALMHKKYAKLKDAWSNGRLRITESKTFYLVKDHVK